MSRIAKIPVEIKSGITVTFENRVFRVIGPKGELSLKVPREVDVKITENQVLVSRNQDSKQARASSGTIRAIISNMVEGVVNGWKKELEIVGTGYRAQMEGKDLVLIIGFSHPVKIKAPEGIEFKVEKQVVTISGVDKELVGQIAAKIRDVRPPEPYKGKGILYLGEVVRRKAGKAAKAAGSPA